MSTPPELPHAYHERHTEKPAPKRPRRSPTRARGMSMGVLFFLVIIPLLACVIMVIGFSVFFTSAFSPSVRPPGDVSATKEAQTFATAQAYRQETRQAANAQETVLAIESATEKAHAASTALAYGNATRTAAVNATAEAPLP